MRKNDAFVAKIVNTRLTKGFMAIFVPAESLSSPATLALLDKESVKKIVQLDLVIHPIFIDLSLS